MFEGHQNEPPYGKSVTVNVTVFTKRTLVGQIINNCYSELHENSADGLVAEVM